MAAASRCSDGSRIVQSLGCGLALQATELDEPVCKIDGDGGGIVAVEQGQLKIVYLRQALGVAQHAVRGQPAARRGLGPWPRQGARLALL